MMELEWVLLSSVSLCADRGQNTNHSRLIEMLAIAAEWVWRYKPKLVRHMAKSPKYDSENGKPVLTKGSVSSPACSLSSEHDALASTCVPMQGWLSSSVYLSSAPSCTWSWSCPSDSLNIKPLTEEHIKTSHLFIPSHQSQSLDHMSLLSTQLPHFFRIW